MEAATAVQDVSLPTVTARAVRVAGGHTPQSAGQDEQVSSMSQPPLGQRTIGVGVGPPDVGVGPPGVGVGPAVGVGVSPGPQQP